MDSKKIKIVTDSVSDITPEQAEKWGITIIPTFVNYGGNSYADDGVELIREEFYKHLMEMDEIPTTAAPAPGVATEILDKAFEDADHLICIHLSHKLSTTINSVKMGAVNIPEDQITFIDSHTVTLGQAFLVLLAAEIAQKTGDVQQVVDAVTRARPYSRVYAAFATMENLRRSGRVSNLVAHVGDLLQIKPIIRVEEGEVVPHQRARTFKKAVKKLEDFARQEGELEKLAILHVRNEEGAYKLLDNMSDIAPPDAFVVEVTPSLGTHIGPGSLGIGTLSRKWRT